MPPEAMPRRVHGWAYLAVARSFGSGDNEAMAHSAQRSRAPRDDRRDHVFAQFSLGLLFVYLGYVVYRTFDVAFGWDVWWLWSIIALGSVLFAFTAVLTVWNKHSVVRWTHWFATYWIALVGMLFGGSILFVVTRNFWPGFGVVVSSLAVAEICFSFAIALFAYGVLMSQRVAVVRKTVALRNLPESWRGKKIVFLSDLHLGNIRRAAFARKVTKAVNALGPAMIVIGGDLYDGTDGDFDALIAPLRELSAPHGTYYASGNHDYLRDAEEFFKAIRRVGIRILADESVDVDGLRLVGVDYRSVEYRDDFTAVLKRLPAAKDMPTILVKHVPEDLDIAARHGVALSLSGHTHNGQIWPLPYVGYFLKDFYYGLHRLDDMQIIVSSGVGTHAAPLRIGTKSEIVEITLEAA